MRRFRIALATAAIAVTMAQIASAADPATTTTTTTAEPVPPPTTTTTPTTTTPAPGVTGVTVTPAPAAAPPKPSGPGKGGNQGSAGGNAGKQNGNKGKGKQSKGNAAKNQAGGTNAASKGSAVSASGSALGPLTLAGAAPTSCGGMAPPAALLPIYQQAAATYGLGPQGPGVLAAINGVESGFGANLGPSSAGAVGWMQFMPSTWAIYGVDANGDGKADPNDPTDAIFSAARYLQAAGMPLDTAGAIFSYNHADWYVQEVLANAGCYSSSPASLSQGAQTMACTPAHGVNVPATYMSAIEDAASRYDLGERGTWAMLAIARLESNFGRGMTPEQLISSGPLGLDRNEWNRFEIDGDGDGRIEHADIYDSAATLAREIWSRGSLSAGIFLHNQAQWYVQQVLDQANQIAGSCTTGTASWSVALPQISTNPLPGWLRGRIDMGVDFSAPPGTPILAPFDAVVVKVGAPGWPGGGGGVLLQPAHGQYVYIYESVEAVVRPGQRVTPGQEIALASATSESTGIEIGFADASGSPLAHGVYREGDVTAWGQRMAAFLTELGAP